MSDINFTDRDLTKVNEHDKNKKSQEARKIRFTGKTASKIANKWTNYYKKKAVQTAQDLKLATYSYDSYIDYANNNATTVDENYISKLEEKMKRLENLKFIYERKAKNSFIFFRTLGIPIRKLQESKAVKLKEKMFSTMKKNGNLIFAKGKNIENEEINIDSINQDNVKQMVDDMFKEQGNNYTSEDTVNMNTEKPFDNILGGNVDFSPPAISEFQYPTEVIPPVYNEKLGKPEQNYNLSFDNKGTGLDNGNNISSSIYRMKKDEIIQDDLSIPDVTNLNFGENDINSYNRESVEVAPERDELKEETKSVEMGLNDTIDDIINKADNGGVSIEDLEQLRRALDAERNKSKELKKELEEKRIKEAEATREAERAEQAKQEKLKFVNDALLAYKEENERLINESKQLDESAQQKISKKQQAMSTIASLNEMIGPTAVNIRSTNSDINNAYKGK